MRRLLLMTLLFPAAVASAADAPLAGRWEGTASPNEFLTYQIAIAFHPDGRYFLRWVIGEQPIDVSGAYRFAGKELIMTPSSGDAVTYGIALRGAELTIRGGDLATMMLESVTLKKVAGSEEAVVREARQADEAKSRDDEGWKKRVPLGPVKSAANLAIGEVPADAGWKQIFPGATVFREGATYVRWNINQRWSLRDRPAPNGGYNGINWHFLSNGRVFFHSVLYLGSGVEGTAVNVDERRYWGRYQIDGRDRISVEMDSGEKHELQLVDGRRNLKWGDSIYGNIIWETEALR